VLALYTQLLRLRRTHAALGASTAVAGEAHALDEVTIAMRRALDGDVFWIVARLKGEGEVDLMRLAPDAGRWQVVLSTEEPEFALDPQPPIVEATRIQFRRPAAVVLKEG
jgi:hypothetical protein